MKKKIISLMFVLILSGFFLSADTIKIASDPWMPFTGDGEEYNGLLLDLAIEIFAEAGHTVEYVTIPWSRALTSTRSGNYNGIAGCYKSDAPDFIFPTNEQGLGTNNLFAKNSLDWKYTGIDSLRNVKLGIILDYSYGEELDAYIEANKKDSSKIAISTGENALERMIRSLDSGRIDVMIEDSLVAQFNISTLGFSDSIHSVAEVSEPEELWIGFSPAISKSSEYAKILSDGMVEFRQNGRLDKILQKYGLEDWK